MMGKYYINPTSAKPPVDDKDRRGVWRKHILPLSVYAFSDWKRGNEDKTCVFHQIT